MSNPKCQVQYSRWQAYNNLTTQLLNRHYRDDSGKGDLGLLVPESLQSVPLCHHTQKHSCPVSYCHCPHAFITCTETRCCVVDVFMCVSHVHSIPTTKQLCWRLSVLLFPALPTISPTDTGHSTLRMKTQDVPATLAPAWRRTVFYTHAHARTLMAVHRKTQYSEQHRTHLCTALLSLRY